MSEGQAAEEKAAGGIAEETAAAERKAAEDTKRFEGKSEDEIAEMKVADEKKVAEDKRIAEEKAEEHKEKSKLGRRISKMEDALTSFMERTDLMLTPQVKPQKNPLDEMEDGDFVSVKDLKEFIRLDRESRDTQSQAESQKYGKSYTKALDKIGAKMEDEELHLKVLKLVTDEGSIYNVRSADDPTAAAQINYYKALHSLGGKGAPAKPNLKGDKDVPPAGAATKTKAKATDDIEFDQDALDYIKRRGLTPEKAKELMKKRSGNIYATGGQFL